MSEHRTLTEPTGAALVLALLVMLVLSGLALVAMNSVSSSSTMSGMHRLQAQSFSMSEGLNQIGTLRSGRQAPAFHAQLQDTAMGMEFEDLAGDPDGELGAMRRGGYVTVSSEGGNRDEGQIELQDSAVLLDGDGFVESVQTEMDPEFGFIVRDPLTGPAAEGFGDEFCLLQVTVGSHSTFGTTDPDGDGRGIGQGRALGRNATTAMIGPIECE